MVHLVAGRVDRKLALSQVGFVPRAPFDLCHIVEPTVLHWLPGNFDTFMSTIDLCVVLPEWEVAIPHVLSSVSEFAIHAQLDSEKNG